MTTTKLLLVRHGNTFNSTDKVVWVGARTDLALTETGKHQAQVLGQRLLELNISVSAVLTGPLKRTLDHANFVVQAAKLNLPIEQKQTLCEIDYGKWEGLSSEEIQQAGGGFELEQWDKYSIWPKSPGWTPEYSMIQKSISSLLAEVKDKWSGQTVMLVTSNGILRFFHQAVTGITNSENLKVKTGRCCLLVHDGLQWGVNYWDRSPEEIKHE